MVLERQKARFLAGFVFPFLGTIFQDLVKKLLSINNNLHFVRIHRLDQHAIHLRCAIAYSHLQ